MANNDASVPAIQASFALPADCTIRGIAEIVSNCRQILSAGKGLSLDCEAVESVDLTFVQFVVSAARSAAARSLALTFQSVPEPVLAAFARAGVAMPAALACASSRS
ncbi:STAS domain-containing protein [Bosea thiooxidans]